MRRGGEALEHPGVNLLLAAGALAAGFLGSLTGLDGGVVIVPLLSLAFGVDIHYAVGASLVSVMATSQGAAAAYLKEGYSNIRIGMFLEVATRSARPDRHIFHGEPRALRSLKGILADAFNGDSLGIIQLGLILLMATPVARAILSVWTFARQGDGAYVAITLFVLGILAYCLLAGGFER